MPNNGSTYDAILFDFDGVLVDSEPVHYLCWTEILAPFGIELPWEYYERHCIGVSDRAMIQTLVTLGGKPELFDDIYELYPKKKQLFRDRMLVDPPMPPETRALIQTLTEPPVAVVTSSGQTEVEPILDRLGLLPRFSTTVYGGDVERLKPAPDPYLLAAARMGAKTPLVIEDSDAGVASGTAAGFTVTRVSHAREVAGRLRTELGLV
jgi:beta-phosphoglucomutase